MSDMRPPRPIAVWLGAIVALIAIALGLTLTLNLVRFGDISPFAALLTLLALTIGVIGFWLMRWWGLVMAVAAALYVVMFSAVGRIPVAMLIMAIYLLPMALVAMMHRRSMRP